MQIKRKNTSTIVKKKIDLSSLPFYDAKKLCKAKKLLRDEINNSFVTHFNYVSYALNYKDDMNYFLKNGGCISECKSLKKKLDRIGIPTYFVSCRANGFSNKAGDLLVKEAHVFLIYPSIKKRRVYFTIFDPGFRMKNVVQFYSQRDSFSVNYMSGKVKALYDGKALYPYKLLVNSRINYKNEVVSANIMWSFNPYYETIDIDEFNKGVYQAMFSLKLMNYPKNIHEYLCIRSKVLEKTLEIYTKEKDELISFDVLSQFTKNSLRLKFEDYFIKAKLSSDKLDDFIENLYLLIHHADTYINNVIDDSVINDYRLGNGLNR